MRPAYPRLAARAVLLHENRLLLVNAYPGGKPELWCAPGGGVEAGSSLPETLRREVMEECGVEVVVGAPCLINEFHDPASGFHQVEVFFRCTLASGALAAGWKDPAGIVTARRLVTRAGLARLRHKPDSLASAAWPAEAGLPPGSTLYDPLEPILR